MNKIAVAMRISEEMMLMNSGFPKLGHLEYAPLTDEDRAEHARAVDAYEEVMRNPWIELSGYEYDFVVRPLEPRPVFVAEETSEEHMARWNAAGRPVHDPFREAIGRAMSAMTERLDAEL